MRIASLSLPMMGFISLKELDEKKVDYGEISSDYFLKLQGKPGRRLEVLVVELSEVPPFQGLEVYPVELVVRLHNNKGCKWLL